MPFDPSNYAVSKSGVQVGKLRQLSEALRREMPPGFEWAFEEIHVTRKDYPPFWRMLFFGELPDCYSAGCALGLAHVIGLLPNGQYLDAEKVQDGAYSLFGLSKEETGLTFGTHGYDVERPEDVMPWMVADALDRIIAREEAASL